MEALVFSAALGLAHRLNSLVCWGFYFFSFFLFESYHFFFKKLVICVVLFLKRVFSKGLGIHETNALKT